MPFRTLRSLACTLLVSTAAAALAQTTIHIPADQPTIQAGINAANNGDTVIVSPGTYRENIDFKGKSITVTSGGAAAAVIDGGGNGPTVTFQTHEPRTAVLSNLTITHGGGGSGQTYTGAGISIDNSTPTILNNLITQNYCTNIRITSGGPLLQGNTISSSLNPEKCSVSETGGINISGTFDPLSHTPAVLIGNTIEKNTTGQVGSGAGDGGAGIWNSGAGTIILNNTIRNNVTRDGNGGGIYTFATPVTIVQNLLYGNFAGCGGGGIASTDGGSQAAYAVLVANNTIADNTGGGSTAYKGCKNVSQIYADPGRYGVSDPSTAFVNNIISSTGSNNAIDCGTLSTSPRGEAYQPRFDHNILFNNGGSFFGSLCVDVSAKYGNLGVDPQFVNPTAGDYRLKNTSPAIDTGDNGIFPTFVQMTDFPLTLDFQGNPRAQDVTGQGYAIVDRGAYEFTGTVNTAATSVVLTSSAYTGIPGSDYNLTATFTSALGTPTGSATFFLDGKQLGVAVIDGTGAAAISGVALNPGAHNLYVTYGGQGIFSPATSVVVIISVNPYATTLTLTSSSDPSALGQPVTFTITSSSADPGFIPSPIALTDGSTGTALATLTPDATGTATYTTSALALGLHNLSAAYAGDAIHGQGIFILFQSVVTATTTNTTLTSSLNPSILGQAVTFTASVTALQRTATGSIQFSDGGTILGTVPLNAAASATLTTSTLTIGDHNITATFVPTGTFGESSATLIQTVNPISDLVDLTSSLNPSTFGQSITLTAHVRENDGGTTTGTLAFYDGKQLLGSGPIDGAAKATYTTSTFTIGSHPITAVFTPSNSTTTYTGSLTQVVNAPTTSAALTAYPTTGIAKTTPVTLTLIVSTAAASSSTLTGSVTFYSNSAPLATVAAANGTATYTGTFPAGASQVYAVYSDPAKIYDPSTSNTVTITMSTTPTSLTVKSSANPSPAFVPITFTAQLFGTDATTLAGQPIIFSIDGAIAGTATTGAQGVAIFTTPGLPAGTHAISAAFPGDGSHDPSAPATLTEQVIADSTVTTLAGPSGTLTQLDQVALLATVQTSYPTAAPTGSVTLYEGSTALGAAVLTPNGAASTVAFTLMPLPLGTHNLVAVFTPNNSSYVTSQSLPITLIVVPASFTLSLSEPTLTLQTGHHHTETVSVTSVGGLTGTLSFGCGAPLAAYTTCTWTQASLALPATGTASTSFTVDTNQLLGFLAQNQPAPAAHAGVNGWTAAAFATLLPLTLLGFRRRNKLLPLLSLLLFAGFATTLTGCGADKYPNSTAPGTYVIPVMATIPPAPGRVGLTQTANLTLIVTE